MATAIAVNPAVDTTSDTATADPARLTAPKALLGIGAVLAAAAVGLLVGPTSIPARGVLATTADRLGPWSLDSGLTSTQESIVWTLRVPRVVLGLFVGATLSMTGAAYQGVFRNPLADPYLLGAAGGAGFGATVAIVNGWGDGVGFIDPVPIAAFVGTLLAVGATYAVGVLGDRSRSVTSLILAGVAVSSFFTSLQTFAQQRDDETIRQVYSWILGSVATSGWRDVALIAPYALITALLLIGSAWRLDVLAVGDEEATSLGIDVGRTRTILIIVASLATAAAVAVSGLIAFVGIIIPHTVRLLFGSSFRVVIPMSIMIGGAFLVLCDLLARTMLSPAELPIGVVTAFFGAPFFIVILRRAQGR